MITTEPNLPTFTTVTCSLSDHVAQITLNRPDKANAMNAAMWREIREAMRWVDSTAEARVAIIDGAGANFCSGIDLGMMMSMGKQIDDPCEARMRENLRYVILDLQDTLTSIERCRKPVLVAIHGACVGGAIDLVSCCDTRYASYDAVFSIKEVDIGMTADVGTLQRLPKIISPAVVRELAYTGRRLTAAKAKEIGLVNEVFDTHEALVAHVMETAREIASKAPLAVTGSKVMINYARDHSIRDGLDYIATWQAGMFSPAHMAEAFRANAAKEPGNFPELLPLRNRM